MFASRFLGNVSSSGYGRYEHFERGTLSISCVYPDCLYKLNFSPSFSFHFSISRGVFIKY